MKLTEQEIEHIKPGIYRTSHWPDNPPKLIEPKNLELVERLKKSLTSTDPDTHEFNDYYSSPETFLDTWIKGYLDFPDTKNEWKDKSYLLPRAKGFELYYVNWHEDDIYNRIRGRKMVYEGVRLEFVMLASDINGMCDQTGYMNVGINDFRNEKILVWRGLDGENEEIPYASLSRIRPKLLTEGITFYPGGEEKPFPFASPNLLKSAHAGGYRGTWTIVGFNPEEIYTKFEDLGFVFPPIKLK